ncbi:DHA2 family efflux MFS transporter permease subunit [Geomesophilobacter sediminis]|uniref:DHA2 family efflux MFS transporter permease subunit n=1 Tax=Geomesophilobacter sediminis TaxID=2798584 RepID=A0A8J7SCG8_9BACT|nr:DHA2 family efflux MFS transporter permease subunit [Geomesophilobacter sediminis]MBJ6727169.1 DHA2 family efflux MFS transporter permease subunit [Geomesophilobacter sediminis]
MSTEAATMAGNELSLPEKLDSKAWQIIAVVILAPFMTQMDATIVNVSLSSIREDLHASLSATQWIISGYLLALALILPVNGWLVDRFGTKRLYLFCFSSFTAASFLCGAAHTMQQLVAARIVQGLAGGLLTPLTQLMMARVAGRQMARVVGYASAPVLLAPLLGPPLAGAILKHASWPWLFYVNLPVGILAVALAAALLPHDESLIRKRPFDLPGFLLLSPGLSCTLYGLEQFAHHQSPFFLALGLLLLGSFIWLALRKKEKALIDLELFRIRTFSTAAITQFLSNGILFAGQFLLPLYLISGAGLSPTGAGWVLTSMGIGMLCSYPFMGFLTEKFGCRAVATGGVLLNLVGTLPFLWMAQAGFSMPLALAGLYLRGLGQGATGIPSLAAAYASVPKSKLSLAATAINIVQRLGGPIATTTLAIVLTFSEELHNVHGPHSFFIPFAAILVLQLVVIGAAIRLPVRIQ